MLMIIMIIIWDVMFAQRALNLFHSSISSYYNYGWLLFGSFVFPLLFASPHKYPSMTTKAVKCSVEEKLLDDGKEIISFTSQTSEEELFPLLFISIIFYDFFLEMKGRKVWQLFLSFCGFSLIGVFYWMKEL